MNPRDNLISLLRRQGYEKVPMEFRLSPPLITDFKKKFGQDADYEDYFELPWRYISDGKLASGDTSRFNKYFDIELKPGTTIDRWGVAHVSGSEESMHMKRMHHPLRKAQIPGDILSYPFPDFKNADYNHQKPAVDLIHSAGLAAVGSMQMTIWETAWYLRSMEELMVDMMTKDPKAAILLDKITELAMLRAQAYSRAGVDILYLGDDIGTQRAVLMSEALYVFWLKPRLKKVIDAAKSVKPDLIVFYHTCGYATPFIQHFIDVGIDVLNPIQSECMDFKEIRERFGDRLSFHGTIGTQTVMPFGSPDDVRREVSKNLELAGNSGGLLVAPTHTLEPGVPWENVLAYVQACKDYT